MENEEIDCFLDRICKKYSVESLSEFLERIKNLLKDFLGCDDGITQIPCGKSDDRRFLAIFALPKDKVETFPKDEKKIELFLKKVDDESNRLREIIDKSGLEDKNSYCEMIIDFRKKMSRGYTTLIKDFNSGKIDINEYSEKFSEKLNEAVDNKIIGSLVNALIQKYKFKTSEELEGLIYEVNKFLSCSGYYTKTIKVGDKLELVSDFVDATADYTDNSEFDMAIKEVESLPYALSYYDNCGEKQEIITKGKVIVWRKK